ncbi:glycogen debranching N-terminal domain-containing protein, partial [Rugosimonospora africana]|uniref:glycogen debranching N-terminal domain-containing protein n=1 Tax=Rugosimonospora africana TaxID=556532 RepID=UPI0023B27875
MKSVVRILDGNTFVLSDDSGDVEAGPSMPAGYFSFDTRFLSLWRLSLNGERLHSLAIDDAQYFEVRFFLVPGAPSHYLDAKASVIRERSVAGGFEERLIVLNHRGEPADFTVRLDIDSDFAPLINLEREPAGRVYRRVEDRRLCLGYQRGKFQRETHISTTEPADIDEQGLTYHVRVGPHEQWNTTLRVHSLVLRPDGEDVRDHLNHRHRHTSAQLHHDLRRWLDEAPKLQCDWEPLTRTYGRSLVDLAALRYSPLTLPHLAMPAAGAPWTATIVGRDSILASLQALPFAPDLAAATLRMLGIDQGAVLDDFRDEEPGKILREFRYGEAVAFEDRPPSPYYGTADATPLFVILLDEYERWTGDTALVREFEDEA